MRIHINKAPPYPSREELEHKHIDEHISVAELADEYVRTTQTVYTWLHNYDIPLHSTRLPYQKRCPPKHPSKEELIPLCKEGWTQAAIAKKYGVCVDTIVCRLNEYNLKTVGMLPATNPYMYKFVCTRRRRRTNGEPR